MKIYILLGFLGAGKTTLLKKLLSEKEYYSNVAVIINEFGQTSIDSQEFLDKEMMIKEITGGSIFCACKFDKFVSTIINLYDMDIDNIIVESSGFSNPTSLHKTIIDLRKLGCNLEPVYITVVDAVKFLKIRKTLELIDNQIKYSNVTIINKIDLVEKNEVEKIKEEIAKINPRGLITCAEKCEANFKEILKECYNFDNSEFTYLLSKNIDFSSLEIKFENTISLNILIDKLKQISNKVYRAKGFVNCDDGKYLVEISSGIVTYQSKDYGSGKFVILYSTKDVGKNEIISVLKDLIV